MLKNFFFSRGSTVIIKLTNREDEGGERELISSENVRMSVRDKQEGNKNRRRRENVSSCHIFRRPTHAAESTPESTESKGARLHSPCFFLLLPNLKVVVKMLLQTLNDYLFGISEIVTYFQVIVLLRFDRLRRKCVRYFVGSWVERPWVNKGLSDLFTRRSRTRRF